MKANFRTLIERTGWIVAIAGEFCAQTASQGSLALAAVALELKAYLASMETVVATARRPRSRVRRFRPPIECSASSSSTRN